MAPRHSLVTGGGGFIGSHLVDRLVNRGDKVTIIDCFRTGRMQFVNTKATLVNQDIKDAKNISKYFSISITGNLLRFLIKSAHE